MPDASIRVICRFRPVNEREKSEGVKKDVPTLEFPDDFTVVVKVPKAKPAIFSFDRVFYSPATTQKEVYDLAAKDTIEDVLSGYNGTIFAYGQTGAGKSFSMSGSDVTDPVGKGIIPRSCDHIFNHIANDLTGTEYTLKCSFLEIYKENIHDLLADSDAGSNLKVRETPSRGVWVQGLSEHFVTSVEDIIDLLQTGEKFRAVSATRMNAVSSRSHSLFILTLMQRNQDGSTKEGKLNLADLAGSEKVGKTGASGETLEEAKKINQSLSALGNCINALTKAKRGHVPYRDSKLTHILRESLGGNSKTTLLIACSPHSFNVEETISTLKFGQRAKTIKNQVHVNQQRSVKELEAIIDNLTRELAHMRAYSEQLEKDLAKFDPNYDFAGLRKRLAAQQVQQQMEEATPEYNDEEEASNENDSENASQSNDGQSSSNNLNDMSLDNANPEEDGSPSKSLYDSPMPPSTPVRLHPGGSHHRDSPMMPSTPQVHFDASYDPMALAEAQLQIQQMRERYELRLMDLKDELSRLSSENRESEEHLEQAKSYVKNTQKEMETLKSELAREREESQLRASSIEYESKKKLLEAEASVSNLQETKAILEAELDKLKQANEKWSSECETAKDERDALDKKLKAAQAEAQRWKLRVDSGAADAAKKEAAIQKKRADESDARCKALEKEVQHLRNEIETSNRKLGENQVELERAAQERQVLEKSLAALKKGQSTIGQGEGGSSATVAGGAESSSVLSSTSMEQAVSFAASAAATAAVEELADSQRKVIELNSIVQKKEIEKKELSAKITQQSKQLDEAHMTIKSLQEIISSNESDMQERAKQRDDLLRESEEAVAEEKEAREKAEAEVRALRRQIAAQETKLVSTNDLLERTQRETQQAALNMAKQMDQASTRVKELEQTIEAMHEKHSHLQATLDDTVEKFARMSAEFSDQLKAEQQANMQLRNTMSRTHRAGATAPGARRAPSNIQRPIKGGQSTNSSGHLSASSTPKTPDNRGSFVDWLFGRDPLPTRDELDGAQKKGTLWKQSGLFKSWKQQWFVLKGHKLYYFTSKDSKVADGVYQIDGCSPNTRRDVEPDTSYKYQFTISHPSRKTVYLCALNETEMASWIEVIDELATCTRQEAEARVFQAAGAASKDISTIPEPNNNPDELSNNIASPQSSNDNSSSMPSVGTPYKAPQVGPSKPTTPKPPGAPLSSKTQTPQKK